MLCQECGKKQATLHFTKIVNGEKTEFHFCETCAKEKGEIIPGTANGFSIHNLLSGLLDFGPTGNALNEKQQSVRCENCGLTYNQFRKLGRFGCSDCYDYFGDRLDPMFRRIQGNTVHSGKIPQRSGVQIQSKRELEELRKELQRTIDREDFEQAASIRDRIREIEKKMTAS